MSSKLKVYELAKELSVDPQQLVDVVQRLGVDIKNSMSVLGSEEVRTVRDYYRKNRPAGKGAPAAAAAKSSVTEKRVGATVIRRRASVEKKTEEVPESAPVEASDENVEEPAMEASVEEIEETQPEEKPASRPRVHAPLVKRHPQAQYTPPVRKAKTAAPAEAESASGEGSAPESEAADSAGQASAGETLESAPAESATPAAPQIKVPAAPRRVYASIIKKVSTEQHLGEVIGPKVEKKERPVKAPETAAGAKPKVGVRPGTPGTAVPGVLGLKRVKEIDLVTPATEAAKEATKRKTLQRQDSVFRSTDYLKRELIHATKKKKNAIARPAMKTQLTQSAAHKRIVEMAEAISVSDLAKEMGIKASAVVAKLMAMGVTATMNQSIDFDTASLVAHEFQHEVKQKIFKEEDFVPDLDLSTEKLEARPPVVTIMGHVDHGKTSLLDALRKTQVAAGEAGGITQHIGAYTVNAGGKKITFVDTPGHEAFTAMRARGAKVTDVVVIVVSAVDGVMPQTLESISHAKAAGVPIIVAINKVDLPDGNPDRIKQTLAGHELNPEEWGGDTMYVAVSAKTGLGLDKLLEAILLQAEILELKANYNTPARGSVIESRLDKNRGPIASVLVQHGKLKAGDIVVCGATFGKVRAMTNSLGQKVNEAGPSDPVEILGLPQVPTVGDDLFVVEDDRTAKDLTTARVDSKREKAAERPKLTLEDMMAAPGGEKELRVILKADVQGSLEALREALSKFPTDKAKIKILHTATGGVVESDVMLAAASRAVILGFNVRPDVKASKLAESEGVELRTFTIIYDLLEDVKNLLEGLLDKTVKEKVIGRAEVREIFTVPKVGVIAGSAVIDGKVVRGCYLRLLRDSRIIYEGKISSLRRFKEDVKEVSSGFECGIGLEGFSDVKLGDQFEAFLKEESKGIL